MDSFYSGKAIIITGASTGIGRALAARLARFRCTIFLLARNMEKLESLRAELEGSPATLHLLRCDVSQKPDVEAAFQQVFALSPQIDIAVLNAGVAFRNSIEDYNTSRAEATFAVNMFGMLYCIEQLLPLYIRQRYGIIAGVSSLADARGFPKSGFYIASKAAASAYLESLRNDLSPNGINVITIKPGFVRTPMTDKNEFEMPFLIEPESAAEMICRGLYKRKRVISFPLPTAFGVRLLKLLPNALFDFIATRPLTPRRK